MAAKIEKDTKEQQQDTSNPNAEQTESNTLSTPSEVVVVENTTEASVDVVVQNDEIIDIPLENNEKDTKISSNEHEVKPKKIPICGLKLPGFLKKKSKPSVTEVSYSNRKPLTRFQRHKRCIGYHISTAFHTMLPKQKVRNDIELGKETTPGTTEEETPIAQDEVDKAIIKTEEFGSGSSDDDNELKKVDLDCAEFKKETDIDEKQDSIVEELKLITLQKRLRSNKYFVPLIVISIGLLLSLYLLVNWSSEDDGPRAMPLRDGRFVLAVTSCGFVEGIREKNAFAFRGIPFAEAPINEQRWRPARLIQSVEGCWNDTLQAHDNNVRCTQTLGNGTIIGEEDCLYLDVITPGVRYDSPLPVVVLIGAESLTGPSPGILQPSASVAHDKKVLFVRPNFRLGAFGFLAVNALTKDTYPRTSGNYGLSDIIAALKWIQLNIYHFGGDPKSVTLWGHRAGATLISALVSSKQAEGLYTRAWASSSSAIFPGKSLKESEKINEQFMHAIDCKDIECLRAASTKQIWTATPDTWLHFPSDLPTKSESTTTRHEWLVLDGTILQHHPSESWNQKHSDHPLFIIGTTAHESHTAKLRERHSNWTAEEVRAYIESSQIGALNLTDEVIQLYNATNYKALAAIISDIRTICPLLTNVRLQPTVPFYVVTQGGGDDDLALVDDDVLAILGEYETKTDKQRCFVSILEQMFFHYVTKGKVYQYLPMRRVINLADVAISQEDYNHCNYWISKDVVPRYAHLD